MLSKNYFTKKGAAKSYLQVGDPVLDALGATVHDVDLVGAREDSHVAVGISLPVVDDLGCLEPSSGALPSARHVRVCSRPTTQQRMSTSMSNSHNTTTTPITPQSERNSTHL